MTKRLTLVLATLCLSLALLFSLSSCGEPAGTGRMTVDLNPSVEFILDSNNKVISVTALNDDGAVLIYGEAFVGMKAEDAAQKFVEIASDMGYITVEGTSADVTVTVNGKAADEIYNSAVQKINEYVTEKHYKVAVKRGEELSHNALASLVYAVKSDEMTLDDAKAKTDDELLAILGEERKATKDLLSSALRDAYYKAKEDECDLAEREETKKVIAGLGEAYSQLLSQYDNLLSLYDSAVEAVENARFNALIAEDSPYQTALAAFYEAKADYLKNQKLVSEMEEGLEKSKAELTLLGKKTALTLTETALNTAYDYANKAADTLLDAMHNFRTQLSNLEENFPSDITATLEKQASAIDTQVNKAKQEFFKEFETRYEEEITAYNNRIKALKEAAVQGE